MAGGEIARLWATVGADVSEFLNKMDQAERRAETTGKQIERAMGFLGVGLGSMSLAMLGREAVELAKMGAEAERLAAGFEALAGADADRMMERMREASRGAIADTNLMLAANRAAMLGVTRDVGQLAQLMEAATARGRAMGLSTAQALDQIITGIGRRSPMILDNLGIVGAQQALGDYAATVGTTADKLSDLEAKQALVNFVLSDASTRALQAAQGADDAATEFERLGAAWANIRTETGRGFAQDGAGLAGDLADWLAGLAEQMRNTNEMRATWASISAQVMDTADQIRIGNVEGGGADFSQALLELDRLDNAMGDNVHTAEQMRAAWQDWLELHPDMAAALDEAANAAAEFDGEVLRLQGHLDAVRRAAVAVAPAMRGQSANVRPDIYGRPIVVPFSEEELASAKWATDQIKAAEKEAQRVRDEAASERLRKQEQANREWLRRQEQAEREYRNLVEGVLSPTSVSMADMWHAERGDYGGKWDEYIRRLRSAMQDAESEWKHLIPEDIWAGGDIARQGYLEEQSAAFYAGQLPDLIDWGALDAQIQDAMAKQAAREALIEQVMARTGGAVGKGQAAALLGLPVSPGEALTADMGSAVAGVEFARPLVDALETQIKAEQEHIVEVGVILGRYVVKGAGQAMTPQIGRQFARALWPYLADLLPEERP